MKKKRSQPHVPAEQTAARLRHLSLIADMISSQSGPAYQRLRIRGLLTPIAIRREILAELADKPAEFRARSIRRRLTLLDRALSDHEAEILERLTTCMNSLSNVGCINYLRSEVSTASYNRLPFSERKRREIEAMSFVLKGLNPSERKLITEVAGYINGEISAIQSDREKSLIERLCVISKKIIALYEQHEISVFRGGDNFG